MAERVGATDPIGLDARARRWLVVALGAPRQREAEDVAHHLGEAPGTEQRREGGGEKEGEVDQRGRAAGEYDAVLGETDG